jgi:metallophosphoesterase (TIGR00282 family)
MIKLVFIGDIVGEAGIADVEARLPRIRAQYQPDFIVANAENAIISFEPGAPGNCGLNPALNERLFAAGVDLITGGNHSWDGPYGQSVHDDPRVLRPLNYGTHAPGRGAVVCAKPAARLGVINAVSRTALREADEPLTAVEAQLAAWSGQADLVLVDFHGESVTEKLAFAYALAGQVTAVVGTHTHVQTLDTRVLPGGTAYVTDVGMTGPGDGVQGYAPEMFANTLRRRLYSGDPYTFATGPVEFGAVLVTSEGPCATSITRL